MELNTFLQVLERGLLYSEDEILEKYSTPKIKNIILKIIEDLETENLLFDMFINPDGAYNIKENFNYVSFITDDDGVIYLVYSNDDITEEYELRNEKNRIGSTQNYFDSLTFFLTRFENDGLDLLNDSKEMKIEYRYLPKLEDISRESLKNILKLLRNGDIKIATTSIENKTVTFNIGNKGSNIMYVDIANSSLLYFPKKFKKDVDKLLKELKINIHELRF